MQILKFSKEFRRVRKRQNASNCSGNNFVNASTPVQNLMCPIFGASRTQNNLGVTNVPPRWQKSALPEKYQLRWFHMVRKCVYLDRAR